MPQSRSIGFSVAAGAALGVTLGFLLLQRALPNDPRVTAVDDLGQAGAAFLAAAGCAFAARRHSQRTRWGWALLGLSAMSWAIGEGIWSWLEVVLAQPNPFPSAADAGFLGAIPLAVAGVLLLHPRSDSPRARLRITADAVIVAMGLLAFSWATVMGPVYASGGTSLFAQVLSLGYPVGDVVIGTMLVSLASRAPRGARLPILLLIGGLAANCLADSGFAYLGATGRYGATNLADAGWLAGYLLIGLAGLRAGMRPATATEPASQRGLGLLLPYVPAAAGLSVALRAELADTLDGFLLLAVALLVAAVMLRQFLALSDNVSLLRRVSHADFELQHQKNRLIAEWERSFRALFEGNPQPMFVWEPASLRIVAVNSAALALYGYKRDEFLRLSLPDLADPLDWDAPARVAAQVAKAQSIHVESIRHRTKSGGVIDVELDIRGVDFQGHAARMTVVDDVTERLALQRNLADSEFGFRLLFEDNPQPMFVLDDSSLEILSVNQAALALYGYTRSEFLALSLYDLRVPEEHARLREELENSEARRPFHLEAVHHRSSDGSILDVEIEVRATAFDGRSAKIICTRDVTDRVRLQRSLEHQAFHDALTGLPNRLLFTDRLDHAHRRAQRLTGSYAVLMLDVDNFKTINDSLGHEAGDKVLVEVSRRIQTAVRTVDTAARLGGDEFAVLLEDLEHSGAAVTVAEHILEALRPPLLLGGRNVILTITIGIAASDGGSTPADVVRNADTALYFGKGRGKARHEFFSLHMHADALERLTLEQDLRDGLARGALLLHYQPKVDSWTGQVLGVEALIRWRHPLRGLVEPSAFIPVAEESDLISELDDFVLTNACRQAREWQDSGYPPVPVAVNVSARELESGNLFDRVRAALDETGLDPRMLELELTESSAVRQESEALALLQRIRDLGVRIAIDDFGTGYSMLGRLRGFPLDTLKIDMSFISEITTADSEAPIVAAMIAMAEGMGLAVVAEGVETMAQRTYLARHGCAQLQGFLISRPVPPSAIPAMLRRSPVRALRDGHRPALPNALPATPV